MDAKTLRKQIRNVLQEVGKEVLTSEVGESVEKKLLESMNARLDQIDKYCQSSLEKQDKRAKQIQSFVLQEVTGKIQRDLFNANVTLDAMVAVLGESGINVSDFEGKINAKKAEIAERLHKEANDAMQANMKQKAAEATSAPENVTEAKQPEATV